jgi:apolipoprotein N-acyltransferase
MEQRLASGTLTEGDRRVMTGTMTEIDNDLLARTRQQAEAGCKIITWTEYNAHVWTDTETAFLEQARQLASEEKIYLAAQLVVLEPDVAKRPAPEILCVNKSVMITPDGEIAYQYVKHNLLVGWESERALRGPREIQTVDTPYGRLSSVICLDMEYPSFMRLAGKQGVDIVLSGAVDGTPSTKGNPIHSTMASYRTIEQGFSLVRGGSYGANVVVDYQGRTLGTINHYSAQDRAVVAQVPIKGTKTLYSVLGDFLPLLCITNLILLATAPILLRRWKRSN